MPIVWLGQGDLLHVLALSHIVLGHCSAIVCRKSHLDIIAKIQLN